MASHPSQLPPTLPVTRGLRVDFVAVTCEQELLMITIINTINKVRCFINDVLSFFSLPSRSRYGQAKPGSREDGK
jgi:hypothetical protein